MGLTRRTVIASAGVITVTGCSTYGTPPEATEAPPASGTELIKTADVPVGGGAVLAEQEVVVTQPVAGTFKAFTSVCTHQSCTMADVTGGTINCTCHGSKFKVEDGSVVNGPAAAPLAEKAITVKGDALVLG